MKNPFVKYGVMYGVFSIILTLVIYLVAPQLFAKFWLSFALMIIPILFMVKAVKEARSANGGTISFGSAFLQSFGTIFIGFVISSLFGYILYNFIDPGLEEFVKAELIESMASFEDMVGEEAYEKMIEGIEEQSVGGDIASIFKGILSGSILGLILSLIISAIMKKDEPPFGLDSNV